MVHTQWNVSRHPPELAKYFLIKPDDRMMPMLPAFWLGGMAMALEVLSTGATLVYPGAPDIDTMLNAIERFKVNRVNGWGCWPHPVTRSGQCPRYQCRPDPRPWPLS